jgi:hypothetical protein
VEAKAGPARIPAVALTRLNLCGVHRPDSIGESFRHGQRLQIKSDAR